MKVIFPKDSIIYLIDESFEVVKEEFHYEKGKVASLLKYEDIYTITFKLPGNTDEDLVETMAEKYLFTKASLDYTKDYEFKFRYKKVGDNYLVNAYIIEKEKLKDIFSPLIDTFKYIDYLALSPFVFEAYYDITAKTASNDAFIYLGEDESYISIFSKGEFLVAKNIINISNLTNELNISLKDLKVLLNAKGILESEYSDDDRFNIIQNYFSQFFMKINNVINNAVSYYRLEKIDRIFFYSSFNIKGLEKRYKDIFEINGIEFSLYKVNTNLDYFDYTAALYLANHIDDNSTNFSIFKRPLPLYKRTSGQIFLSLIGVMCILGVDYGVKSYIISSQEKKIKELKEKSYKINRQNKLNEDLIKKYKKEISSIKADIKKVNDSIEDYAKKILLLEKINKAPLFINEFMDLVSLLKKYKLKISSFDKNGNLYSITIISKYDNSSSIALFIKDLLKLGYKNAIINKVEYKNGLYISKVVYND